MMFFLTALDQQANQKEFSFELFSIEKGFDFLSLLVTQGNTLLSVYIAEDNHRIDLPLEAFDGHSFSAPIQGLQQEWQTVLSEPIPPNSPHKQEMIALTRRRIDHYQTVLAAHKRMIRYCTQWLERNQQRNEESRELFKPHYEQMLLRNQHQFAKVQFRSHLASTRLGQLMACRIDD